MKPDIFFSKEILTENDSVKAVKVREEIFFHRRSSKTSPVFNSGWLENLAITTGYVLKRLFDGVMAFVLIVGLSPLFVLIFIFIRLESYGCIFYGEKCIGKDGELFRLYQFRIFHARTPQRNFFRFLLELDDGRERSLLQFHESHSFTQIGKWLHRLRLNNLPKLFNVFLGDMSLLGPRPWTLEESRYYSLSHRAQLHLRPGLIFWGNSNKIHEYSEKSPSFQEMRELSQSNWLRQIGILLKISLSIFFGRVAY